MKKVLLAIIDGFGLSDKKEGNAIKLANTPNLDYLFKEYGYSELFASGLEVGLPQGQMGNSEVGHLNIGAGRLVYQPIQMINEEIKSKNIFNNKEFIKVMEHVKKNNSKLHIMGLLSDGGIHSHINHFFPLIEMAKMNNISKVYIHPFLDGRDTKPDVCMNYLKALKDKIDELEVGKIASLSGRYYSMDREGMWNLTELVYNNIVNGLGSKTDKIGDYIKSCYDKKIYDEFIPPVLLDSDGLISDNDGIILINIRADRTNQLFSAITNCKFDKFQTKKLYNLCTVTMMEANKEIIATNAYSLPDMKNTLGEYLAKKGLKVLRIAEASKFAHVTYFFDGGNDVIYRRTNKVSIARQEVPTYDLCPEMSSVQLTDRLIKEIPKYDFILVNYANLDMVGHSGYLDKTIKAVEVVDSCIGRVYKKLQEEDGILIIIGDHGNAEYMLDESGNPVKTHTMNKVPFMVSDKKYLTFNGKLGDVAPTILKIMDLEIPKEMTGNILIN